MIGTEISDTARRYANTVQWDFPTTPTPTVEPGRFRLLELLGSCLRPGTGLRGLDRGALRPGGRMLLDHGREQMPASANALDPFGITFERLQQFLIDRFAGRGRLREPIDAREINPALTAAGVCRFFEKTA